MGEKQLPDSFKKLLIIDLIARAASLVLIAQNVRAVETTI